MLGLYRAVLNPRVCGPRAGRTLEVHSQAEEVGGSRPLRWFMSSMDQPPGDPARTPGILTAGPLANAVETLLIWPSQPQLWICFIQVSRIRNWMK